MTTPNIEELRLLAQTLEFSDAVRCSIQRAADLLQSQAERIKELESEVEMWKATANAVVDFEKVQLRAEIAAIAATEPVAYRWVWKSKPWDIEGWCYTNTPPTLPELQEIEPLFTRPMPAQGVEASMIELPEPDDTYCGVNYYTEAQLKQAVSDALDAELVKDAERYRWLRDYLISPSTHFDDFIVSADKADTLDGVIDAARAARRND